MQLEIVNEVINELRKETQDAVLEVPIGVSARHCHFSEEDFNILFGDEKKLTKLKELSQPGQFAANETVLISGPKGSIEKVRILGPFRKDTQVEISQTDSIKLGVTPPIRQSGDIGKSSAVTIIGPKGSVYKKEGLIIAQAHIHTPPEIAQRYRLVDGQKVSVIVNREVRKICFSNVIIRIAPQFAWEMHIDTDEANASSIQTGQKGKVLLSGFPE